MLEFLKTVTSIMAHIGGLFGFLLLIGYIYSAFQSEETEEDE